MVSKLANKTLDRMSSAPSLQVSQTYFMCLARNALSLWHVPTGAIQLCQLTQTHGRAITGTLSAGAGWLRHAGADAALLEMFLMQSAAAAAELAQSRDDAHRKAAEDAARSPSAPGAAKHGGPFEGRALLPRGPRPSMFLLLRVPDGSPASGIGLACLSGFGAGCSGIGDGCSCQ